MVTPNTTPPAATFLTEPKPAFGAAPMAIRRPDVGATFATPPAVKPAAPAPTPASGGPTLPAPAAMVPSYVAKAMERQRAKEAKENQLVPAPTAPAAPAVPQTTAESTEAPLARPGFGGGATAATTTTPKMFNAAGEQGTPPPKPAAFTGTQEQWEIQTGYRKPDGTLYNGTEAATATQQSQIDSANATKLGEINATSGQNTQADTVNQPVSGIPVVTPATPPAQAAQLTKAQQEFNDLVELAKKWMNAKEDPASRLAFSRAITQSALVNQEAMNAVRGQIASNPALAGQPAGDALLALRAGQMGMQMAELKGSLAIQEQREISRLNQLGFEATMKLNEMRKTEDERNLASYGSVLDEMITGGADEETLNEFFNANIKPLLPGGGAGMTLDMFRNKNTRATMLQGARSEGMRLLREAIAANADAATINQLVAASYTAEQLTGIGQDWLKGKSLKEINDLLRSAGYEEIDDMTGIIGDADLIGQAKVISDIKKEKSRKPYDDTADDILEGLIADGVQYTPEMERDVRAWVRQQALGISGEDDLSPWKDERTAHLYGSWPLPGQTAMGKSTIPESSAVLYARNEALDDAWEAYVLRNPDSFVTREKWYNSQSEAVKNGELSGSALTKALQEQPDPEFEVPAGQRVLSKEDGLREINKGIMSRDYTSINWNDPNVKEYMLDLAPTKPTEVGQQWAAANTDKVVKINGQPYVVAGTWTNPYADGRRSNDYIKLTDPKTGKTVWMQAGTLTIVDALPVAPSEPKTPAPQTRTR